MSYQNQPSPRPYPTAAAILRSAISHVRMWGVRARQFWLISNAKRRLVIAILAVIAILTCGLGSIATLRHIQSKPDGYLWSDATNVGFVQFTQDQNNHLTGTFYETYEANDQTIRSENVGFTGAIDGSRVTMTFSELDPPETIIGTLGSDTLTLQIPDRNGYIATDVFHAASVADYNNAAALLRQHVAAHVIATQAAAATATIQAARDYAVISAKGQLSTDLSNLSADSNALAGSSDFSGALGAYAKDWTQMQQDYQTEQNDYQQGCGQYGSNAGVVQADAGTVEADDGAIQADDGAFSVAENSMNTSLSAVHNDIAAVNADWSNLQAALAADTSGTVSSQFTQDEVNGAVTNAQQQITASNKSLASAQAQTKKYDQEAQKTSTDAQNLANSMHC